MSQIYFTDTLYLEEILRKKYRDLSISIQLHALKIVSFKEGEVIFSCIILIPVFKEIRKPLSLWESTLRFMGPWWALCLKYFPPSFHPPFFLLSTFPPLFPPSKKKVVEIVIILVKAVMLWQFKTAEILLHSVLTPGQVMRCIVPGYYDYWSVSMKKRNSKV